MKFLHIVRVEMSRAAHRRLVRWMVVVALLGCVVCGIIAFASSSDATELARADGHPAVMRSWWGVERGDDFLNVAALFLAFGGAVCGASVAGAEWRSGTMTTVLTWQPSRPRLHLARTLSAAIWAFVLGFLLQALFLASTLPAVWVHGTTSGTDRDWWIGLVWAMLRISFVTSLLAVLAFSLATIGRNTAAALIVLSIWALVLEGLIRNLKPGLARFLVGENVATFVPWRAMKNVEFHRSPALALLTLTAYVAVVVGAAALLFERRDVGSA